MLLDEVTWIRDFPEECGGTLVLDTADWAQKLAVDDVCSAMGYKSIEDAGYGKGYTYVTERFGKLLNLLSEVCERGCNVVVTAHAIISKFEQPDEMGAYDRWGLEAHRRQEGQRRGDAQGVGGRGTLSPTTRPSSSPPARTARSARPRAARTECSTAPMPPLGTRRTAGACRTRFPWSTSSWRSSSPSRSSHGSSRRCSSRRSRRSTSPRLRPSRSSRREAFRPVRAGRPAYLKPLYDLMRRDGISAETVSKAISVRGYFPEGTPVDALPEDFAKFLVSAWDSMRDYINSGMAAGRKE